MSKLGYSSGIFTANRDEKPPGGGKWYQTGSLSLESVQKPLILRLWMTEIQLLTMVQNINGRLQKHVWVRRIRSSVSVDQ